MAVDLADVCALAADHQSSLQLAIWLSTLFSIYKLVAMSLAALVIYTSSHVHSNQVVDSEGEKHVGTALYTLATGSMVRF